MKRVTCMFSLVLVGTIALGLAASPTLHAEQKKEYVVKAKTKTLLKTALHGVPGKKVTIFRAKFPAGYVGGRHSHSGPIFVYVLKGSFTIEEQGKGKKTFQAGQLYVEPIGQIMQAKNLSAKEPIEVLVFQVSGEGEPLMYKAK